MKKIAVFAGAALAALIAGCATVEAPPPEPEGGAPPVGRIDAAPFAVFSSDEPCPSGVYFFNRRMQWYEVIRPVNDSAAFLFFASQADADAYVLQRFAEGRREEVPLFESWPPPFRAGEDFDALAMRDLGQYISGRLEAARSQTIRHPDWGDTGQPAFRLEQSGLVTEHIVYERYGYVSRTRRLNVMSANIHFHSVWWNSR